MDKSIILCFFAIIEARETIVFEHRDTQQASLATAYDYRPSR